MTVRSMDSGKPSDDGWVHVDPFNEAQGENADSHAAVGSAIRTDSNSSNRDEKAQEAAKTSSSRSESSVDAINNKVEPSSSHEDTFMDKVKEAAHEAKAKFHLEDISATGPSKRFNPTNVRMHVRFKGADEAGSSNVDSGPQYNILWRSRDNRKGRGSIAVARMASLEPEHSHIHIGSTIQTWKEIGANCWKMCTTFPYWNLAFWSGWAYAWGSVLFIISATMAWIFSAYPKVKFNEGIESLGVPITTFIGVCLYQLGATTAYFEAINDGSFHGSAMRRLMEGHEEEDKAMVDEKIHNFFHHVNPFHHKSDEEKAAEEFEKQVDPMAGWRTRDIRERPGSIYPIGHRPAPRRGGMDLGEAQEGDSSEYTSWRWWPTWHMVRTHHAYEIGWLACSIQGFGVTLFGWTGIALLPGVWENLGGTWGQFGAYWIVQMVASLCFIIASVMFTLETQEKWWKPQPNVLGWWIGFVALLGSMGFE